MITTHAAGMTGIVAHIDVLVRTSENDEISLVLINSEVYRENRVKNVRTSDTETFRALLICYISYVWNGTFLSIYGEANY